MRNHCDQLFGTIFCYFVYVDCITYFIAEVVYPKNGWRTFYDVQCFAGQVELASDGKRVVFFGFALHQDLFAQDNG